MPTGNGGQKGLHAREPHRASLSFTPPFSLILLNLEDRYWTRKGTIILDRDVTHKRRNPVLGRLGFNPHFGFYLSPNLSGKWAMTVLNTSC